MTFDLKSWGDFVQRMQSPGAMRVAFFCAAIYLGAFMLRIHERQGKQIAESVERQASNVVELTRAMGEIARRQEVQLNNHERMFANQGRLLTAQNLILVALQKKLTDSGGGR